MYAAKSTRGNQYRLYRPNMEEANDKWLLLETKLHQALKKRYFRATLSTKN